MSGIATLKCGCGASLVIEPWYGQQIREWRAQHDACLGRSPSVTQEQVRVLALGVLTMHRQRRDFRGEPVGCSCGAVEPYREHLAREIATTVVP